VFEVRGSTVLNNGLKEFLQPLSNYVDSLLMVEYVSDQAAVLNKCHTQYVSEYILLSTLMMYNLNISLLDFKPSLQLNAMKSSPASGFVNVK
jgi:hypothetical protein